VYTTHGCRGWGHVALELLHFFVIYPCKEGRYGMLSHILHCLCILPTGVGDGDVALELLHFFAIYPYKGVGMECFHTYYYTAVIPKVRRTVAKVRQKLSWTDKIILIVGPIDRLTYARKYFILASFLTIVKSKYLIIALIISSA
jgi:hypothetical protein